MIREPDRPVVEPAARGFQAGLLEEAVLIRHLAAPDLPALEWEGEYAHFRRLYAQAYQRAQAHKAVLWVADLPGDGVVGQLFVQLNSPRPELADGQSRAYLYSFRVRPRFRQAGIGSRLLQVAEADLRRRGRSVATLNVSRDNSEARRLYERRGYRVVAPEPGKWQYIDHQGRMRWVDEPAWRMEKHLR